MEQLLGGDEVTAAEYAELFALLLHEADPVSYTHLDVYKRQGMFSAVQFLLAGARVLDLFAGSGQLGIEALSRCV